MAMWMRATPEAKAAMQTRRRHAMVYRMKGMRAMPPPGARRFFTKDMAGMVSAGKARRGERRIRDPTKQNNIKNDNVTGDGKTFQLELRL